MDERIRSASKYNLWYNNTIDSGFQRQIYTKDIDKYLGSKVVKVLTGQRRVGKAIYSARQPCTYWNKA